MIEIITGEVSIPATILSKWLQPRKIYRSPLGYYVDGLTNAEEFRATFAQRGTLTFYVSRQGNDNNDGLTEATALKTIKEALFRKANTIYIKAGIYDPGSSDFSGITMNTNFIGYGGPVYVGRILSGRTWRQNGHILTMNEIYNGMITHIFSLEEKEKTGLQLGLTKVDSEVNCKNMPFSFALVNNVLHVNYPGLNAQNIFQKLIIPIGGSPAISPTLLANLYFENLTFIGNCEFKIPQSKVYFNRTRFHYAGGDQLSFHQQAESILFQCQLAYSLGDGVDYNDTFGIEIDCFLTHHGQMMSSNQNSTGHINSRIIRVGGVYQMAQDSNIYDISGSQSLNAGCLVGGINRRNPNGTPAQGNIVSGYNSSMWIDGVKCGGGYASDRVVRKEGHEANPVGKIFSQKVTNYLPTSAPMTENLPNS